MSTRRAGHRCPSRYKAVHPYIPRPIHTLPCLPRSDFGLSCGPSTGHLGTVGLRTCRYVFRPDQLLPRGAVALQTCPPPVKEPHLGCKLRRLVMDLWHFDMGGRPVQTACTRYAAIAYTVAACVAHLAGASCARPVVRLWVRVVESGGLERGQRRSNRRPTLLCAMLVSVTVRRGRASGCHRPATSHSCPPRRLCAGRVSWSCEKRNARN